MTASDRQTVGHVLVRARDAGIFAMLALFTACDSGSPTEPSPLTTPRVEPPTISALTPNVGSTSGGTTVTVSGNGFQGGAAVTIDGVHSPATFQNSTLLRFTTAAHEAGAVDIVVVNPGEQTARLAGGYTFEPPQSFDFNGTWRGLALAHPELAGRLGARHSDMEIWIDIRDNIVVSVMCAEYSVAVPRPLRVVDGAFAATATHGADVSGRIVSATDAVGTIDTPACPGTRWSASKQS